jgi:hypothetical protein
LVENSRPESSTRSSNPRESSTTKSHRLHIENLATNANTPATAIATRPAHTLETPAPTGSSAQPKAPRVVTHPAPVVPDVTAGLSRLIETYLAVCFSIHQDEHRETCRALAASWRCRAERERQIKLPDYRTEILALVREVEGHMKVWAATPAFLAGVPQETG